MLRTKRSRVAKSPTPGPPWAPRLTARGEARRTVLALWDGARTLECIEREVYGRHANLFRDYAEAQLFVAEVVTRYSG